MEHNEEKNLIVNINDTELINQDIKDSNEIYANGYMPYFARRLVDVYGYGRREIVNDESVEFEFASLYQYNSRKCSTSAHIHDLIDYMKSQGTMFVPWILYNSEDTKKEGIEYKHANMAWEILKKYISHIVCEKLIFTGIYSGKIIKLSTDDTMKNLEKFIDRKDLIDFIMTSFKFGYNPIIAKIMADLIVKLYDNTERIKAYIHEDVLERMVVFTLVNSKKEDLKGRDKYIEIVHKKYPELIVKTASGFQQHEVPLIDLSLLNQTYLHNDAVKLMDNGFEVIFDEIPDVVNLFAEGAMKKITSPKKKLEFKYKLMIQPHFVMHDVPLETLFPINNPDIKNLNKYYEKKHNKKYEYIHQASYLYKNIEKFFSKSTRPFELKKEWINTESPDYVKGLSLALLKMIDNTEETLPTNFVDYIFEALQYYKVIMSRMATSECESESKITDSPEFQLYIRFLLLDSEHSKTTYIKTVQRHILEKLFEENSNIARYFLEILPEYFKVHNYDNSCYSIPNKYIVNYLEGFKCKLDTVMKCLNIYDNFEWFKENLNVYFVELPDYVFSNARYKPLTREMVEWSMEVLTKEQQQTYIFSIETMRENRDIFEKLITMKNMDRYTEAYGINWVEEHTPISISDMVNSNSYINHQVIERYLDIILLDEKLRVKMLNNPEVCEILIKHHLLEKIFEANNFTNIIKCEVLFNCIKHEKIRFLHVVKPDNIESYLIGSKYIGRALIGIMASNGIREVQKYLNSNIFDIEENVSGE